MVVVVLPCQCCLALAASSCHCHHHCQVSTLLLGYSSSSTFHHPHWHQTLDHLQLLADDHTACHHAAVLTASSIDTTDGNMIHAHMHTCTQKYIKIVCQITIMLFVYAT